MSRLSILAVGTLPPHQGGSAVSFWQLLVGLQRAGHRIRAISARTPGTVDQCKAFDAALGEIENQRYQLDSYPYLSAALGQALEAEQRQIPALMESSIARERPDIILVGRDNQGPAVARTALRHGIPWVLRSTGYILRTIEEGCHPAPEVESIVSAAQQAEWIVLQGQHLVTLAQELGYRRTVVIPNAVDEGQFAPQPRSAPLCARFGVPFDAPIIVHASNLKPVKRIVDMIDSAPAVLARYPHAVYIVAGEGHWRAELEQRCQALRVAQNFRFPGWLPYADMSALLSLADVVVMPSAFEQQAGVYIETQACGRTLLASDIPAAREVVEDGRTGLLFRLADVQDLADKTLLALADPGLRRDIGQRAAGEVLKRHSLEKVASQFEALLRETVEINNERTVSNPA